MVKSQLCGALTFSLMISHYLQGCQPCGFPVNLGLFFLWSYGFFFEDLRVACFWACFNLNLLVFCRCLFCGLLVFQIVWYFFCFNLLLKTIWAFFCENMLNMGLFFRMCLPVFLFNFPADFLFC